jgi:glycine dehydrogenase subunit 1
MGPQGLREICEQNIQKTDYAVNQVKSTTPHTILFPGSRFNEFVIQLKGDYATHAQKLLQKKIVPGFQLSRFYPELGNAMLVCVTETTTKDQIDAFVKGLA